MTIKFKTITKGLLILSFSVSGCVGVKHAQKSSFVAEDSIAHTPRSLQSFHKSARDIGYRSARWQLRQIGNLHYIPESHRAKSESAKWWIQGALYIGMTRWIDTVNDKELLTAIEQMAKQEEYSFLTGRPYHADDHTIAQTYLWLTEKNGNQDALKPTKELFDWILENKPQVSLDMRATKASGTGFDHLEANCQLRWCWADALFMAPRAWLKLSNITGDSRYFDYADKEFWASVDYLFSEDWGLYYRDSRYFDMKTVNDKPVFWSRGNGWVFAALPMLIEELPKGHPSKARYIELFKKNAAGLLKRQAKEGHWPASLADPELITSPEMSGTGFITFGLAWGVNNGILTSAEVRQSVIKGWEALERAVEPSGRLNYVQHPGKAPQPAKKSDSQLYGVGALLLAASEMTKFQ